MPISDSFLGTCRGLIDDLPELSTFRAALANITSTSRAARSAAWAGAFGDAQAGLSPAYRLRRAIRDTVNSQADIAGNMSGLDRESAYRTMAAEFVPEVPPPPTLAAERDELERLRLEDSMS